MSENVSRKQSRESWPQKPSRVLWAAVLVPPALWALQGLAGWYIGGHGCAALEPGWPPGMMRVTVALLTVVAIAVVAALLWLARRHRRDDAVRESDSAVAERARFVATLATVAGVTLLLGVVLAGLPALVVHTCGQAR